MPVLSIPFLGFVGLVDSHTGAEITQPSYARVGATFDYCLDSTTIANLASAQWPQAREDWGVIDEVQVWDSATGGTLLGTLVTAELVAVPMYARARMQASGITSVLAPVLRPFGTLTFGTGRYGTEVGLQAIGSGVGSAYNVGPYGAGPYETLTQGVVLEITFGAAAHVCQPGQWQPGPWALAA